MRIVRRQSAPLSLIVETQSRIVDACMLHGQALHSCSIVSVCKFALGLLGEFLLCLLADGTRTYARLLRLDASMYNTDTHYR